MPDYTEHTALLAVMRREYGILVLITKGKEKNPLKSGVLETFRVTRDFCSFSP